LPTVVGRLVEGSDEGRRADCIEDAAGGAGGDLIEAPMLVAMPEDEIS
jgi:hypothetical protein